MNKRLLAAALASAFAANAHAFLITVEPDDFTHEQNISALTPGVTLQWVSGSPVYAYETDDFEYASTGTRVFGYDAGFGVEPYWDDENQFRADFAGWVNYVSIDVVNNDEEGDNDSAYMEVYGVSGLLATVYTNGISFPGFETLSFYEGTVNISYILMSSADGADYNLDRMEFGIPAAPTLALFSLGLLGLASTRARVGGPRRL
ncbi:hypothetical protein [Candidatus Thiodictyon syntrophicum]|jgi:hypothetical protein|uniref:PEP-CTERM protein-sorting domain-containing protein n=1 Tax=Candidatus Thiodictyon syntrophicum TaxID=1166950 RepID=A0A2K8U7J9_9GAMM|nr:hypothetical protein [Candidatus Thiodictyon syntrophicum]AUB81041.1 hypothetical protein THSYN_08805 [Candidatus Thiodictyon syntrophicum]